MKKIIYLPCVLLFSFLALQLMGQTNIQPGAANTNEYIKLLKGKQVAVFANQTSVVGN